MGHFLLGRLPGTPKWTHVVDLIASGADAPAVALAVLSASKKELETAAQDPILCYTTWLLTQVPLAAKGQEFFDELRVKGLQLVHGPTLMEVMGSFTDTVDAYADQQKRRSDIGEMAQLSAVESLTSLIGEKTGSLFGATPKDVKKALRSFTTKKNFSLLTQEFFARFLRRYLSYFLSRELSNHVGPNRRFANIYKHIEFNQALDLYCRQVTRIVKEFAEYWFSEAYEGGINLSKARTFTYEALKKIRDELGLDNGSNGQ
ncbi:MAG: hypothetical protein ACOZF2_11470 [Thermodesulfobacteriota bacterium]